VASEDTGGSRWAAKEPWRGWINGILYGVASAPQLDEAVAAGVAQSMVSRRFFEDGPQPYAAAIPQALAYPGRLNDEMQIPYGESEIRAFLVLLAKKLDELRPLS
jgi:hypothetical protein